MVQALDSGGAYVPKDLLKDPSTANVAANSAGDKDVFTFVAPNLKTNSVYQFQFKYVFADGVESDEWSPTYTVFTSNIATLPKPKLTAANVSYFQGILRVTWDGTDYNGTGYGNGFSRILIWVRDNTVPGQLFKIVGELSKPGTWSLAVPPKSQTVKLTAISVNGEESAYSDEFTVTPVVTPPVAVTSVTPSWSGTNFNVAFTHDPTATANEYLKEYIVTLVGSNFTKTFSLVPSPGTSQQFSLSLEANRAAFGVSQTSFSGNIKTLDIYGNYGTAVPFNATSYASALSAPTITVTETVNGYKVSYTAQTSPDFKGISIEEVVSNSNTDPGTGYTGVATGTENPITVASGVGKRWVRARLYDTLGAFSGYSNSVSVTPIDIVAAAVDAEAPGAIQSATAVALPDASDTGGTIGLITLTIVNSTSACPSDFNGYIVKILRSSDSKEWTQSFNSKTYLTTLPVNLGITVGQSYTLSVATTDGRNQSAFVNVTGNPISVTDNRTNTSVATNLVLSATDSILNAKWTAPADPKVDSYRVQLTSTFVSNVPDFTTPLQEVYANSTVVSFGGLAPSTKYGVRVTTRYSNNGPLSTNHLIASATLNSSGAISDGIAPTTNPALTSSMVKSLFGAFAITFPPITNSDAVTYEVFIKPTDATGIVSNTYKVLEVNGTFAVVKTLADRTTPLSYGTNYYIAIRAKDNDGVSTGTVTAVGPVQTLQVANADLAADSVYANNIKAGEIDASKMITDLLFASKTINVGESTTTNRIRLDGNTVTITDTDLPSPSTYTAKGRIFIGAGNYYSSGTSFYADNTGRFSIGDKLKFDGTNLTVNGSGTFTGLLTTGSGSNLIKVGTGANGVNNGLYIQQGNQYIYTDGTFSFGGGSLTGTASSLNVSGTMTVKGNSELQGDLKLVSPGVFYIGANKASGQRLLINDAGIAAYNSGGTRLFALDTSGAIDAQSGLIAGWTLGTSAISKTSGTNTISLSSSTNSISTTGTNYTAGFGLPDGNNIVFWAGGSRAETANFWVKADGSARLGSVTITGYATSSDLTTGLGTKIGAADVNANVTSISGGVISTGAIQSNNYSAPTTGVNGTTPYSVGGTRFNISDGSIISKSFVINSDGSAAFKGTLSAGISIDAPVITGGSINIGNGNFMVSSLGALTATSGTFNGNVVGGTFSLSGSQTFNYWSGGAFNAGNGTIGSTNATYVNINASTGKFIAYSSSSTQDNVDGSGLTTINVPQLIEVNGSSVIIQGLAGVGNGLTAYGDLLGGGDGTPQAYITQYRSNGYVSNGNEPSANYGTAARYRMIIADPYDYNKLKRGFGVYYGVRSSAPTASTGLVGDVWISW